MKKSNLYRLILGVVLFLAATVLNSCGKTYQGPVFNLPTPILSAFTGTMEGSVGAFSGYTLSSSELSNGINGVVTANWTGPANTFGSLYGTTTGLTMTITKLTQSGCTVSNVSGTLTADKISSGAKLTGTLSATLAGGATCTSLVNEPISLVKK